MKNNFKELRESLKLSQSQFANKFNMPVKTVQSWESGIRNPPKYVLIMMLRICELEAEIDFKKSQDVNKDHIIEFCNTEISMLASHKQSVACAALRRVKEYVKSYDENYEGADIND